MTSEPAMPLPSSPFSLLMWNPAFRQRGDQTRVKVSAKSLGQQWSHRGFSHAMSASEFDNNFILWHLLINRRVNSSNLQALVEFNELGIRVFVA
jgi:hypothetical protein